MMQRQLQMVQKVECAKALDGAKDEHAKAMDAVKELFRQRITEKETAFNNKALEHDDE